MDDLIYRQQAVEAMYALVDGCVCDDEWRENPHIDAIIDTLENLPSAHLPDIHVGDTISRQEAIDVINVGAELLRRVLDDTDVVGAERAKYEWGLGLIESYISDIKELPSTQQEIILCKDCIFYDTDMGECDHKFGLLVANENSHCSLAERRNLC